MPPQEQKLEIVVSDRSFQKFLFALVKLLIKYRRKQVKVTDNTH